MPGCQINSQTDRSMGLPFYDLAWWHYPKFWLVWLLAYTLSLYSDWSSCPHYLPALCLVNQKGPIHSLPSLWLVNQKGPIITMVKFNGKSKLTFTVLERYVWEVSYSYFAMFPTQILLCFLLRFFCVSYSDFSVFPTHIFLCFLLIFCHVSYSYFAMFPTQIFLCFLLTFFMFPTH